MANTEKPRTSNGLNSTISKENGLPDDFYPVCWQDDERMDNLFDAFRDKSVNPVNYESKMKFWKNLIQEYCTVRGNPTTTLSDLRAALQRKGKRPYCLDTVFEELLADGLVKTKSQYMQAPLLTWSGWAVHKLVKAPLRWGFDRVKETVIPSAANSICDENTEYVTVEVAKVSGFAMYQLQ